MGTVALEQFANSASSTLNGSILIGATSLIVNSATPFPTVPQFRLNVEGELMLVTGVAGTTFTVTRGIEGTSAAPHSNGVAVTHIITAGGLGNAGSPLTVGTTASQTGAGYDFQVVASTTNAVASSAIDTGYKPGSNHVAQLSGGLLVTDRTAHTVTAKNLNGSVRNYGGLVVAASLFGGTEGDGALSTVAATLGVSGGGTLTVLFTPPAAYVDTLEWILGLSVLES